MWGYCPHLEAFEDAEVQQAEDKERDLDHLRDAVEACAIRDDSCDDGEDSSADEGAREQIAHDV